VADRHQIANAMRDFVMVAQWSVHIVHSRGALGGPLAGVLSARALPPIRGAAETPARGAARLGRAAPSAVLTH
jgi:hypothetical protein